MRSHDLSFNKFKLAAIYGYSKPKLYFYPNIFNTINSIELFLMTKFFGCYELIQHCFLFILRKNPNTIFANSEKNS